MAALGPLGFAAPWLLLALAALPVLWWLLRTVPPAPVVRRFPGVALLLGLRDDRVDAARTPWWLLALRALAVAALVVGFAGPVLNPQSARTGDAPLLIVADGSWASARDWARRSARIDAVLAEARRADRAVAVVLLTDLPDGALPLRAPPAWQDRVAGLTPAPHAADPGAVADWAATLPDRLDSYWLSDGLDHAYRGALTDALQARGRLTVFETTRPILAAAPPELVRDKLVLRALRLPGQPARAVEMSAIGRGPAGAERALARATLEFEAGAPIARTELALQPELRNRISRVQVAGQRSAGAVALTDDALQRRKVALLTGRADGAGTELLSPFFYLREALDPIADLVESPSIDDLLLAGPDVLILVDVAALGEVARAQILDFVRDGGMLLRFAGPRLAASELAREAQAPLMPVRLRIGGRTVGGAMSWGAPRRLRAFAPDSPFAGLDVPDDVTVSAQVLAQPDPGLSERSIATLADGTPLVTRRFEGDGQIVLMHTTANADWTTLPLSGLFVQMLERLTAATRGAALPADARAELDWQPRRALDAFGDTRDVSDRAQVPGAALAARAFGPDLPPGVYSSAAGAVALNLVTADTRLKPAVWPADVPVERDTATTARDLRAPVLLAGLAALMADIIAALWLSGRLRGARAAAVLGLALVLVPAATQADDRLAQRATSAVVLAHVLTGDARVDEMARAGLRGLSRVLYARTSIEPDPPIGLDLENDTLTFFPFLYWPVTETTPIPSDAAYAKLNRYLRGGGMILFDTRDAELAGLTRTTPEARRLQAIARPLDIPPLEPVPDDHVLTRTFYLLQDFPGRHTGRDVWVEAAPPDAERAEGMPFRDRNDGVTPVIIGSHDWAAAWAVDEQGQPMVRLDMGMTGQRQREMAYRFGVNLITHVLTGNYKSDQVHVPALLERLGQ